MNIESYNENIELGPKFDLLQGEGVELELH